MVVVVETATQPHVLLTFGEVQDPLRLPRKTTSERQKVLRRTGQFFTLLTWTLASRHNSVHTFSTIELAKTAPRLQKLLRG